MKVFIATPSYGDVSIHYTTSVVAAVAHLPRIGIEVRYATIVGCCYVTKARDMLFAQFLASDCTHLLWIDSDMAFTPSDVFAAVEAGKDVVALAYPKKRYPLRWMFNPKPDADGFSVVEDDLVEISEAGTGFLCFTRAAAEAIEAAWAEKLLAYRIDGSQLKPQEAERLRAYFATEILDGEWISEDYVFCRRWTSIGGRIWLYPGSTVAHVGSHRFEGTSSDFLGNEKEAP